MANVNLNARLSVTERFVTIQQRWLPSTGPHHYFYPWMRISGRWLEHAGFKTGQRVKIDVEHGRLTITAE